MKIKGKEINIGDKIRFRLKEIGTVLDGLEGEGVVVGFKWNALLVNIGDTVVVVSPEEIIFDGEKINHRDKL